MVEILKTSGTVFSVIVWAIADDYMDVGGRLCREHKVEGRSAAAGVDSYLMGSSDLPSPV